MNRKLLWSLPFSVPENAQQISPGAPFLHLGSCFASVLGNQMQRMGWPALYLPLGIAYHPLAILRHLKYIAGQEKIKSEDFFEHEGRYRHYDFHSEWAMAEREESMNVIEEQINTAKAFLQKCEYAVITFGTSIVHQLKDPHQIVNNRHKQPANLFTSSYLSINEILDAMESIHQILMEHYRLKQIIWTVSPVRHYRSGLVENNRSKARLIIAIEDFLQKRAEGYYFPSYEILIDVLRDHRFYGSDLVHPSPQAEEYIVQQFIDHNFDKNAQQAWSLLKKLRQLSTHKVMNPSSEAQKQHDQKINEMRDSLSSSYPWLTKGE